MENQIIKKIALAFSRNTYPVTAEGQALKDAVKHALDNSGDLSQFANQLPTVENPRLELFQAPKLPHQKNFLYYLTNIQVTKGCSHRCTFCAAGAAIKVQSMPFQGVLFLAEAKKKYVANAQAQLEPAWLDWLAKLSERVETELEELKVNLRCRRFFRKFEGQHAQDIIQTFIGSKLQELTFIDLSNARVWPYLQALSCLRDRLETCLTHYYDSDPFDYKDPRFLHENGRPADFADVVKTSESPWLSVHITTAGWVKGNHFAKETAEKLVALAQSKTIKFINPRISVNKTTQLARRCYLKYRQSIEEVLDVFHKLNPELLFFYEKKSEYETFINNVVEPVRAYATGLAIKKICDAPISGYSGNEKSDDKASNHDVMACMPGYHVWPNGQVAWQQHNMNEMNGVAGGTRPVPIGQKIW